MKITVTEAIPGANCTSISENKYECTIKEQSSTSLTGVGQTLGFVNTVILIISFNLLLFVLLYRLLVKYTNTISNKDSGKRLFKYLIIVFIISVSLYILGFILNIIAPWVYAI